MLLPWTWRIAIAIDLATVGSFQTWSVAELPLTRRLNPALAIANLSGHLLRSR